MRGRTIGALVMALLVGMASPGLAGHPLHIMSTGTQGGCGDTVADLVCTIGDMVWGPGGLVSFATGEVEWAQQVLIDIIFVIPTFAFGGLL